MAENLEALRVAFFNKGQNIGVNSPMVGRDAGGNRVARYSFHTPASGASSFSWEVTDVTNYEGSITSGEVLRFYVGRNPDTHINAGADAVYDGEVLVTKSGSSYTVSGYIDGKVLLPDTDYYLFIFPAFSVYGLYAFYYYSHITITVYGAAGVVRIKEGDRELLAVPMVKEGGELVHLAATVKSGENLNYCV